MLGYRPGDRFQSAKEVIQALKLLTNPNPNPQPPIPSPQPPTRNLQPPANNVSQVRTIAVGRPPEPIASNYRRSTRQEPVISEPRSSFWDDPWAIIPVGIGLAILAGFGSWALVSTILQSRSSSPVATPPTVFPTEIPTPSETPTPTPTSSPSNYSQKLNISTGQTISKQGTLKENDTVNYIIRAEQGQQLDASLSDEGVLMTILGPDQNPVDNSAKRVRGWKGTLPYSGDYQIQLKPIKGLDDSNYQLNISLSEALAPSPTPTQTLTPTPTPSESPSSVGSDVGAQAINFPAGQNAVRVPGIITSPQQSKLYVVNAQQGQIMSVNLGESNANATVEIRDPNGQPLDNVSSGVLEWNGQLPSDGQYQIEVSASEPTRFNLDVSVGNP
jgi:serine/threonine-protein kinase